MSVVDGAAEVTPGSNLTVTCDGGGAVLEADWRIVDTRPMALDAVRTARFKLSFAAPNIAGEDPIRPDVRVISWGETPYYESADTARMLRLEVPRIGGGSHAAVVHLGVEYSPDPSCLTGVVSDLDTIEVQFPEFCPESPCTEQFLDDTGSLPERVLSWHECTGAPMPGVDSWNPTFLIVPYSLAIQMQAADPPVTVTCDGNGAGSCDTGDTPTSIRGNQWTPVFSPDATTGTDGVLHVNYVRRSSGGGPETVTYWTYQLFDSGHVGGRGACSSDHMTGPGATRNGPEFFEVTFSESQRIVQPPHEDCPATYAVGKWSGGAYDP